MCNLLDAKNVQYNPFVRSPAGIHTLPETNLGPENRPSRKETASSLAMLVSERVPLPKNMNTSKQAVPKLDDLSPHQTTYHVVHTPFDWRQLGETKVAVTCKDHAGRCFKVTTSLRFCNCRSDFSIHENHGPHLEIIWEYIVGNRKRDRMVECGNQKNQKWPNLGPFFFQNLICSSWICGSESHQLKKVRWCGVGVAIN